MGTGTMTSRFSLRRQQWQIARSRKRRARIERKLHRKYYGKPGKAAMLFSRMPHPLRRMRGPARRLRVRSHERSNRIANRWWRFSRGLTRPLRQSARKLAAAPRWVGYTVASVSAVVVIAGLSVALIGSNQSSPRGAITAMDRSESNRGVPTLVPSRPLIGNCDSPSIWQALDEAVPEATFGGSICTLGWMAVQLTAAGEEQSLVAYLGAVEGGTWELVAVGGVDGTSVVGDLPSVPRRIVAQSQNLLRVVD